MAIKAATAIPTIDVNMISITVDDSNEIILDTASKLGVVTAIETQDAIKLVIKGVLKAQKKAVKTVTGNTLTLTDNVFSPEIVKIFQGGTITYDSSDATKVTKYEPPVAGSDDKGQTFTLCAYSAQYDTSGEIINYEKTTFPNCTGSPISMSSEDGVFRVNEYTIESAPATGEAPYTIEYVETLPEVTTNS